MRLAIKYAQAYLGIWDSVLDFALIEKINEAAYFLYKNRRVLFLLQVPLIPRKIKEEALQDFCIRFELPDSIHKLIVLLLDHKRGDLIAAVFKAIVVQYKKRHAITTFFVSSTLPLTESQCVTIEQFMNQKIVGTKLFHYTIDSTLIAGIRIQSDTLLWEYSIAKRLRTISHIAIR